MTGGSYYYYECRGCKVGTIAGVESKIESPKKLEEPLLKKIGALSRDYCWSCYHLNHLPLPMM